MLPFLTVFLGNLTCYSALQASVFMNTCHWKLALGQHLCVGGLSAWAVGCCPPCSHGCRSPQDILLGQKPWHDLRQPPALQHELIRSDYLSGSGKDL